MAAAHTRAGRVLAAAALGVLATVALPASPARAATCAAGQSGVTVVVDFASLGGGVVVGCASGDPASGLVALQGAGFDVDGTDRWGLAFVCRINGKPTAAAEPCVNTPPASAYWSYWHAHPGGAWSYSQLGAMSYNPAPGSVEGWAFGSGSVPSIAPPHPVDPPPPPPPPRPPATTAAAPRTTAASAPNPQAPTPEATAGPATPSTSDSVPVSRPASTAAVVAATDPDRSGGSGGPGGVLVGAGVVLALGGGATVIALQRRRQRPGE